MFKAFMIFSEFKWKQNDAHFYVFYIKGKKRQHEYVQEKTIPDIRSQLCLIIENIKAFKQHVRCNQKGL